jgi:hypothetical protein
MLHTQSRECRFPLQPSPASTRKQRDPPMAVCVSDVDCHGCLACSHRTRALLRSRALGAHTSARPAPRLPWPFCTTAPGPTRLSLTWIWMSPSPQTPRVCTAFKSAMPGVLWALLTHVPAWCIGATPLAAAPPMGDHFDHARDEGAPHDPSPGSVQMPSPPPSRPPPIRTYSGTRVDRVPTPQPQPQHQPRSHRASDGSWSVKCSPVHPTATPAIQSAFPLPRSACTIPVRVCPAPPRQAASPVLRCICITPRTLTPHQHNARPLRPTPGVPDPLCALPETLGDGKMWVCRESIRRRSIVL